MQEERKIDYLEMPATDVAATRKFFEDLFGWQFTDYGPEYSAFSDERINGGFFKSEVAMSAASGSALVVFYAQALEPAIARVQEAGGTISKDIFSFPGGRRFHFKDPSGNEFAVWSDQ